MLPHVDLCCVTRGTCTASFQIILVVFQQKHLDSFTRKTSTPPKTPSIDLRNGKIRNECYFLNILKCPRQLITTALNIWKPCSHLHLKSILDTQEHHLVYNFRHLDLRLNYFTISLHSVDHQYGMYCLVI